MTKLRYSQIEGKNISIEGKKVKIGEGFRSAKSIHSPQTRIDLAVAKLSRSCFYPQALFQNVS